VERAVQLAPVDDPEDGHDGPVDPIDGPVVADPEAIGRGLEALELLDDVASGIGVLLEFT